MMPAAIVVVIGLAAVIQGATLPYSAPIFAMIGG